jgi:hypothetical protein
MLYKILHAKTKPRIKRVYDIQPGFSSVGLEMPLYRYRISNVEVIIHSLLSWSGMNFKPDQLKLNYSF